MNLSFKQSAFTLLELLITMAIVAVLIAAGTGAYSSVCAKGKMVREIRAGKNLVAAYQSYAGDNNGSYLPGMDFTVNRVWFEPYRRDITIMHASNRYPFRLAPYFDYALKGTILVNDSAKQINSISEPGTPMHDYVVSAFPTFGINYYFVGGCVTGSPAAPLLTYPDDCTSRVGQGEKTLLVFASGGTTDGTRRVEGYNILTPPMIYSQTWSSVEWKKNEDPGIHGNIDARHAGKAVCVYLDGSIKLQTIEELRDMRLWNRKAAEQNDPQYTLPF